MCLRKKYTSFYRSMLIDKNQTKSIPTYEGDPLSDALPKSYFLFARPVLSKCHQDISGYLHKYPFSGTWVFQLRDTCNIDTFSRTFFIPSFFYYLFSCPGTRSASIWAQKSTVFCYQYGFVFALSSCHQRFQVALNKRIS